MANFIPELLSSLILILVAARFSGWEEKQCLTGHWQELKG